MKKILLVIPFIVLLSACAKPAESKLPDLSNMTTIDSEGSEVPITFYQSKLTPANSTLTTDDSSEKIVSLHSTSKNTENISTADTRAEVLLQRQVELRKHIDREFIDINQYMLELVEGVKVKS